MPSIRARDFGRAAHLVRLRPYQARPLFRRTATGVPEVHVLGMEKPRIVPFHVGMAHLVMQGVQIDLEPSVFLDQGEKLLFTQLFD